MKNVRKKDPTSPCCGAPVCTGFGYYCMRCHAPVLFEVPDKRKKVGAVK